MAYIVMTKLGNYFSNTKLFRVFFGCCPLAVSKWKGQKKCGRQHLPHFLINFYVNG